MGEGRRRGREANGGRVEERWGRLFAYRRKAKSGKRRARRGQGKGEGGRTPVREGGAREGEGGKGARKTRTE